MSSSAFEEIEALRREVNAQGEAVRVLKRGGTASKEEVEDAVKKLQDLKIKLKDREQGDPEVMKQLALEREKKEAEKGLRTNLEDLLTRRFFYIPSFEIYQGVGGLYDFGPNGCAMKQNLMSAWRRHFVLTEQMLEVDCAALTPEVVLKTSGHVDKFTDFMVKDEKTGDCFRADKLLEEYTEKTLLDTKNPPSEELKAELKAVGIAAGAMNGAELKKAFDKYGIKSPDTGNNLSDPFPFNLMFQTQIGPTGKFTGYLRPETAQGIFVNFRRLLEQNAGRMPFAAAQIGLAFRNEISPRQGLLRVREFSLAEIEHFVNPNDKSHSKFQDIASLPLSLLPRDLQVTGEERAVMVPAGEAVAKGMINNETLAYFMARTQLFLTWCGVKLDKLRFRQHKSTEMAHYASDCWDAEILSSYGWVECVGHADRSAYDLQVHTNVSKVELMANETYATPRLVEVAKINTNNGLIGKTFGKAAKEVGEYLRGLAKEENKKEAFELAEKLKSGPATVTLCTGTTFEVTPEMVQITPEQKKISSVKYIPSVIEPSFGLGRILYSILEHSYYTRPAAASSSDSKEKEEKRAVLSLPPHLAPTKLAILPLSDKPVFEPFLRRLTNLAILNNISYKVDASSSSIGRRYARADEIGTPFGITVDFQTEKDDTVTIRERDSMQQIRAQTDAALRIVADLTNGLTTWEKVYETNEKWVTKADE